MTYSTVAAATPTPLLAAVGRGRCGGGQPVEPLLIGRGAAAAMLAEVALSARATGSGCGCQEDFDVDHFVSDCQNEKGNTISSYDFLVNSLWPEIVRGLEEKLPSLFNPGDPDAFHQVIYKIDNDRSD
uniref:Uncharacterized protein n=1 Tax=Rangifer tarandus platyrhynchus TaxID=3082113 RepID=A0ACB0E2V8_RANTA|nr:unnamed protein product [Rangifer tarandus platyrhynchus]